MIRIPHLPDLTHVRDFFEALRHPPPLEDVRIIGENAAGTAVTSAPTEIDVNDLAPEDRTDLVRQVQDLLHEHPAFGPGANAAGDVLGAGGVDGADHPDVPPAHLDPTPGLDDLPG